MESMSRKRIKRDIDALIQNHGGDYSAWCVGVTAKSKRRFFKAYKIDKAMDLYLRRRARSSAKARDVSLHFLNKGCEGTMEAGGDGADRVYVYRRASRPTRGAVLRGAVALSR
jgi:hypothetical protein